MTAPAGRRSALDELLRSPYRGIKRRTARPLAAAEEEDVRAVVSRGGGPDLAAPRLGTVRAPTLLIVGERDEAVLALNRSAQAAMSCETRLEVIPGATHLVAEPGTLERAARLAGSWFVDHLAPPA